MCGVRRIATGLAWGAVAVLSVAGPAYAQGGGENPPPEVTDGEERGGVLRMLVGRLSGHLNGSYQATSRRYETSSRFSTYEEEALFVTRQEFPRAMHLDVGGAVRVWRELAVGASYTEVSNPGTVVVRGTIPHPLDFGRDRTAAAPPLALAHRERAVHAQVGWRFAVRDGLDVMVSAGPSYFNLIRRNITGLTVREMGGPAFGEVDLRVGTAEHTRNGIGFNAGIDTTLMLTPRLGAGYFVRITTGSIGVPPNPLTPGEYQVGGFQTGVGLRVRF